MVESRFSKQQNQHDGQERKKLLAAALHLFVEFGFHDTPASKIA